MFQRTLNSALRLIRKKSLYSDGDELSVVNCTSMLAIDLIQELHILHIHAPMSPLHAHVIVGQCDTF